MNSLEVRDFLFTLGKKVVPIKECNNYERQITDGIENIIWKQPNTKAHVHYWIDNEASLRIEFPTIGAILVIFEIDGDDAILSVCDCDVYDGSQFKTVWKTFKYITDVLDDELNQKYDCFHFPPF